MARIPDRSIKVRQATIDAMNKKGMEASIAHANSGKASAEEVEAARRFYGKRITGGTTPVTSEAKLPRSPLPKPASAEKSLAEKRVKNKYAVRSI